MARTCPGVLLFAAAADRHGNDGARLAASILQVVEEGVGLVPLIDGMLEAWLGLVVAGHVAPESVVTSAAEWLEQRDPWARASRMKRWRLFVRKAVPMVSPRILLRPAPLTLVPEEIPTRVDANARWYEAMACHDAIIDPMSELGPRLGRRLTQMLSRRPVLRRLVRPTVRFLVDHPDFDPAAPGVTRLIGRVVQDIRRRRLEKQQVPMPPLPALTTNAGVVWPLDTVAKLHRESREMHHCAESYVGEVEAGRAYLYGARLGTERITVELRPMDGAWLVTQAKAAFNGPASADALQWLAGWCPLAPWMTSTT